MEEGIDLKGRVSLRCLQDMQGDTRSSSQELQGKQHSGIALKSSFESKLERIVFFFNERRYITGSVY